MQDSTSSRDPRRVREDRLISPLERYLPIIATVRGYDRDKLVGDLIAGLIVAIMLIPQGMAYALLAGLPPQQGLYASILPLILYGLLGTSRTLAVGPVAIVSLLTAASVGTLAAEGSADYILLAITLAFLVGLIQTVMGLFRIGFLVNFLSHPVLVGFSAAAAIVIGFSQVKSLLGISIPRREFFYEQVWDVLNHLGETNLVNLSLGLLSVAILIYFKRYLTQHLLAWGAHASIVLPMSKSGPLVVVLLTMGIVFGLGLDTAAGVMIVGDVPGGLPQLAFPSFNLAQWQGLLTTALAISFVGYMESISVAKSLAAKRRERIDANQELIALGIANLGATFTGGYPVTGGFSRSLVNFDAGARTTIASIITALLVAISLLLLAPLFFYIPKATLAAIIIVAVTGLIDLKTIRKVWGYNKGDAAALFITFAAVLGIGIENGILVGAGASLLMFIARTSNPHVAVIGRLPGSEFYRNVARHTVETWPEASILRIDASLYFANSSMFEDKVNEILHAQPALKYLILVGTAINDVDFSALEVIEQVWAELTEAGVELHLAAFKGPVMDKLDTSGFIEHLGEDHIHLTTHAAVQKLLMNGAL